MEKKEINLNWTRLAKRAIKHKNAGVSGDEYWKENEAIKEAIAKLYRIDRDFDCLTLKSLRIFLSLNCTFRAVTLHTIGSVDIKKIVHGVKAQYY